MTSSNDDVVSVQKIGEARDSIVGELRKSIVGMDDVIDEMMIAIFAQGHVLLVGVPLGKPILGLLDLPGTLPGSELDGLGLDHAIR